MTRKIGEVEIKIYEERCNVCGGDIPDQIYWEQLGETNNGYCPGHIGEDGFCGAFCPIEDEHPEAQDDND